MRYRRSAALLLVTLALVGCRNSAETREGVEAEPAYALLPPDAVVIRDFGDDDRWTIEGTIGASAGRELAVTQSLAELDEFYAGELTALGWEYGVGRELKSPPTSTEPLGDGYGVRVWSKDDLLLRIAIYGAGNPERRPEWDEYETVIEVRLTRISD